jgi:hypothetical protein
MQETCPQVKRLIVEERRQAGKWENRAGLRMENGASEHRQEIVMIEFESVEVDFDYWIGKVLPRQWREVVSRGQRA